MVKNELEGKTFNAAIQAASNYIGQKLFAYISHGKNINSRIREKFAKSMIFIGDEGQIYNPLTNTYIGIGQTAYTNAVSYIEEAHEKIDSLNKMLTSSMVTSIYANWGEDTWRDMTYAAKGNILASNSDQATYFKPGVTTRENNTKVFEDVLPTKIFATNDIVLRGIGDYDPTTKLAYTREFAHITDSNLNDGEAKKALEGSYILNKPEATFATSGITVSLEKGLNKYMFTYTFRHPMNSENAVPGADPTIWTQNDVDSTIDRKESSNYAEKVTFYLTIEELTKCVKNIVESKPGDLTSFTIPGTNKTITKDSAKRIGTNGKEETINNPLLEFWKGVVPVWDDEVFGRTVKFDTDKKKWIFYANKEDKDQVKVDYWFLGDAANSNYWTKREFLSHQLFKQGKNVMTIDDKLTWSYISSAYSYALDFSKEYTDSQVERIYRELLGSSNTLLIPCGPEQVKVQQIDPRATKTLDLVNVVWDDTHNEWITTPSATGDGVKDTSNNLTQYKLNEGSIYVTSKSVKAGTTLNTFGINTAEIVATNDTVLPWFVLTYLSKMSEQYIKDYNACYAIHPDVLTYVISDAIVEDGKETSPAVTYQYITDGTKQYRYANNYQDKLHNALAGHTFSWVSGYDDKSKTNIVTTWSTPELGASDKDKEVTNFWNKVFFMNYERDSNYPEDLTVDDKPIKISEDWYGKSDFVRDADSKLASNNNDLSYYDNNTTQPPNGEFGVPVGAGGSAWTNRATHNHNYLGTKYSLTVVYKIVDDLADFCNEESQSSPSNTHEPIFVVNTKWTSLNDVNLADGIQTLKEITYVLDIITDGWGNHYEDAEGNGILLTYTIANNHDRIVDHEKRLKQIESGTNVVKGIGRLDHMMSKYVDLQLTSDVLWKFNNIDGAIDSVAEDGTVSKNGDKLHLASDKTAEGNRMDEFADYVWDTVYYGKNDKTKYGLPETTGFVGITIYKSRWSESTDTDKSSSSPHEFKESETGIIDAFTPNDKYYHLQQIPVSYIVAYNSYIRNWTKDRDFKQAMGISLDKKWKDGKYPKFSDVFSDFATIGIINVTNDGLREITESGRNSSYVFTSPEGRFTAIHSYVGHVGMGIDLKLAQTYTTSNIQGGESGFVCVDIRSSIIKKKVNVHAKLPKAIKNDSDITWKGTAADINNGGKRYSTTLTIDKSTTDKSDKVSEFLNNADKELLKEKLADMGLALSDIDEFDSELVESNDAYGATFTFAFVINVNDAINKTNAELITGRTNYDGRLYADVNYGAVTYMTTGSAEAAVTTYYTEPNFATYYNIYSSIDPKDIHNASSYYRIPAAKQELIIPSDYNGQTKFFVRFAPTDVLAVDLEYDGLTTTNWVATYVAATVDSVSKQLKAVEYESYRFAENLINGLDNAVYGSRGKFVSGIEQRNGIVTPIYKDLPKDELFASYSVWGENTDVKRNYQKVTTGAIYKQEVLHGSLEIEYPLYIAPEGKFDYVLCTPANMPYIAEISTTGKITFDTTGDTDASKPKEDSNNAWINQHGVIGDKVYAFDKKTNKYVEFTDSFLKANFTFDSELSTEATSGELLLSSWKVGEKYGMYVPMYFKVQAYERINPAQLRAVGVTKENKVPTDYSFTAADKKQYTANGTTTNNSIYTVSTSTTKERKYITASAEYSDQTEIGNGKNTLQITAHITKLVDADKDNSGLVDAYDVKTTINSMFEWVDLSRWDLDTKDVDEVNPLNSPYNEEDGNYSDAFRIANSAAMGAPIYPRESYNDADYIRSIGYERLPNDAKTALTNPTTGDKYNTNPTAYPTEATTTKPTEATTPKPTEATTPKPAETGSTTE